MNVVTTFSPSGWDYYGKRFVGIRETHLELPENFSLDDI